MTNAIKQAAMTALQEAINELGTSLAADVGTSEATKAINEVLVELGDKARLDSNRQLFLVQGRVHGDDDDRCEVIEAASAAEAIDDLREDLATGPLRFDSLDAYEKAEQAGQLAAEQEIITIGVRPVLGGDDDEQPKQASGTQQAPAGGAAGEDQDAINALIAAHGGSVWDTHPEHPREHWQYEVANGDTVLGYWAWVLHSLEEPDSDD